MINGDSYGMNTTAKGDIAEQAVVLALLKAGKTVLRPVSNGLRYDLVVQNLDATFTRIQCKTGTLKGDGGVVRFRPRSADARRPNGVPYHGQIDAFGVYCPQNQQVYLVPIVHLGEIWSEVSLRLLPARAVRKSGFGTPARTRLSHAVRKLPRSRARHEPRRRGRATGRGRVFS